MRVIVAGTRTFNDQKLLNRVMDEFTDGEEVEFVLSGAARGADACGEWWAHSRWHTVKRYHADWQKHGKAAGPLRNREMVKEADALVAFWDGQSPGTKDVIQKAREAGLKVKVVRY